MISERCADFVRACAPAKVNLFLEVLRKRPDGYHEIASLMLAVSLYDTLTFREDGSGQITLRCDEPSLPVGPENLVIRAADLLRKRTGFAGGARIELKKRIPLAAGLAGGSSDAAATLEGLNKLWQLGMTRLELATLAADIGSDVAFFFSTPAAWCTGRGEVVTPWPLNRPLHLLLACPDAGLSTAEVYRNVAVPERPREGEDLRRAVAAEDAQAIGQTLHNRLQPAAEKLCPEVPRVLAELAALGPLGQAMSGSGTTVFALCRDRRDALRLAGELRRKAHRWPSVGLLRLFVVRSCF